MSLTGFMQEQASCLTQMWWICPAPGAALWDPPQTPSSSEAGSQHKLDIFFKCKNKMKQNSHTRKVIEVPAFMDIFKAELRIPG